MDECSSGSIIATRIPCILSYAGSFHDIVINYALLVVNVASCWLSLLMLNRRRQSAAEAAAACLLFTFLYQIGLCLALGCAGISIIWCACAGWMLHQKYYDPFVFDAPAAVAAADDDEGNRDENPNSAASVVRRSILYARVILVADFVGILYYFVVEELITTVAHICAVLMGCALSMLSEWYMIRQADDTTEAQPLVSAATTTIQPSRQNEE